MAERQELQVVLRTVAQGQGAQQTSAALRQVGQQAAATNTQTQALTRGLASYAAGFLSVASAAQVVTAVFASSINLQRENERVTRATAAAYGESAQLFQRFANTLAAETGFTSQAILEAALSARTLSANYGLSVTQTQNLIRASADLARVRGIGVAEAFERVQSAIRGEAEASEYLGLTLNDTFIKNNALNGSVRTTFERMTDAQKAQIRYDETLRQTAVFKGLATQSVNSLDGALLKAEASANRAELALGKLAAPATIAGLQAAANAMDLLAQHAGLVLGALGPLVPLLTGIARIQQDIERFDIGGGQARAAAQRRAEQEQARLRALNENLPGIAPRGERPSAAGAFATERAAAGRAGERQMQNLRELAYLDQRDAAVRDLLAAQREEVVLKDQLTRMEREQGDMVARRAQVELAVIAAQQRALPAQLALADTERAVERARLVLGIRGTSLEERRAARGTIREAERNVLPGQRLAAFDVETGVIAAQRGATAFDLSARVTQIAVDQAMGRQEALIAAAGARVDAQQQVLGQIMQQAIADGFLKQPPTQVTVQLLDAQGQVTYEELIEAADQAGMPPVVRVSGVRR